MSWDDELELTDPVAIKLKERLADMSQLSREQKLGQLATIIEKNRADMAKEKGRPSVSIMFGHDLKPLEFVPSGIIELDQLCGTYREVKDQDGETKREWTGTGGPLVRGRWVVWWGSNGCGKTTMALRQVRECQERGLVVGYFNSERALDPIWCVKQGVNLEELVVWEGGNLEQNMNSMIGILEQGLVDIMVVDTIHAFAAKADTEAAKGKTRTMEDEPPRSPTAKALSRFFRVATHQVSQSNCGVLLIGQARQSDEYEELTGGHALGHYNSLNLHFIRLNSKEHQLAPSRKIPKPDGGFTTVSTGFVMKIIVDKTRINHRDRDFIEVPFLFGLGPDNFEMNVMAAVKLGIIAKVGNYYTLRTGSGDIKVNGREQLIEWMRSQQAYYDWLLSNVTGNFIEPAELTAKGEDEEAKAPKTKKGK